MTTLAAGDIAFMRFQSDDPDSFSFVALSAIGSGTVIRFTDNAWTAAGAFSATPWLGMLGRAARSPFPCKSLSVLSNGGFACVTLARSSCALCRAHTIT
jgi:hypothetical protein